MSKHIKFSREDYIVLELDQYKGAEDFIKKIARFDEKQKERFIDVSHRLGDINWLTKRLEEDVKRAGKNGMPGSANSLLWLQIYLLLTCADTLGYLRKSVKGVRERFDAFFENLTDEIQEEITDAFWVCRHQHSGSPFHQPSKLDIQACIPAYSLKEKLQYTKEFLYICRNRFTHESKFPELGHHPNLVALQMHRLKIQPNERPIDRIQVADSETKGVVHLYFVYYNTDDPVYAIRRMILLGIKQFLQ